MNFLSSIFLGTHGVYKFGKTEIIVGRYDVEKNEYLVDSKNQTLSTRIYNLISQNVLDILVHEGGHAITGACLYEIKTKTCINISTERNSHELGGSSRIMDKEDPALTPLGRRLGKKTSDILYCLNGPLFKMTFCAFKMRFLCYAIPAIFNGLLYAGLSKDLAFTATVIPAFLSTTSTITSGLSELAYMAADLLRTKGYEDGTGDFAEIRKRGFKGTALSALALSIPFCVLLAQTASAGNELKAHMRSTDYGSLINGFRRLIFP